MSPTEWADLTEALLYVFAPVLVGAVPLVLVAGLLAALGGGMMEIIGRWRKG